MKWTVEHIDLCFYNAGENRWEMFVEPSGRADLAATTHPESFFRRQLQRLLGTVREALVEKAKPSTGTSQRANSLVVPISPSYPRADIDLDFGTATGIDPKTRIAFAKYCSDSLEKEGIQDIGLVKALERLESSNKTRIPIGSAFNLLSVVPIARDWDVMGWLHPMSTSSTRFEPESYWKKSFAYRIRFPKRKRGTPKRTNQPLDYDVFLQVVGDDAKANVASVAKEYKLLSEEVPYFDFAKSPFRERRDLKHTQIVQQKMTAEEFKLYRAYATVIDAVQKGESENHYYIVYPVVACGYYHFLQIKIRPDRDGGVARPRKLLAVCKKLFKNTLSGNEYAILKESIRELLIQIRLSAFQHYTTDWMVRHAKEIFGSADLDSLAVQCFCELAPHINEMRVAVTKDAVWSHVGRGTQELVDRVLKPWAKVVKGIRRKPYADGEVRAVADLPRDKYVIVKIGPEIELWLFHNQDADKKFREQCYAGTNQTRLEEQFEWMKQRMRRFRYALGP